MEVTQDLLCGKTSAEPYRAAKEETSRLCYRRSLTQQELKFMCLCLRNGKNQEPLSWTKEIPFLLRGEPLTPNFGESPNAVEESSLSRILQDKVPCKYYLSRKACLGILRRAEARGKELPGLLRDAFRAGQHSCPYHLSFSA